MKCTDKEWQHCRAEKMGCNGCAYNEIKVGDYVRTNEGIIGKIKRIEFDKIDKSLKWYVFDKESPNINIINEVYINKPYISKYNPNILKLIEYGDVLKIKEDNSIAYLGLTKPETTITLEEIIEAIKEKEVELLEILTKEQFENNSYKVEG